MNLMRRRSPDSASSDQRPDAQSSAAAVTRRRFLTALAAAGAGAALGSTLIAGKDGLSTEATAEKEAPKWAFVVDLRRCDGCEKCTKACVETHHLNKDQTWIKVYERKTPSGQTYYQPRLCMQCQNPPCVRVCPTGATYKNKEGVVLVNQEVCIGCRTCMASCPYEARYFNWDQPPHVATLREQPMPEFPVPQKQGTVGKCILCVHNIDMGKLPACVEACTMEALFIGELTRDVATNGRETVKLSKFLRENDAIRFREELGTQPRVWYILGHGQRLDF